MSYSTNTSLLTLMPQLPQTSTTGGYSATVAIIDRQIVRADNMINSKISARYDVSNFATSVPPILQNLSEDIATYFTMRTLYGADNQNVNEWTEKYQDSIEILNDIRKGDCDLIDSSGNIISEREASAVDLVKSSTMDYTPFFDEDSDLNWKVDRDKIDAIGNSRD